MTWHFRHDDIRMQQLKATGKEESASTPHALLAVPWRQPDVSSFKPMVSNSQALWCSQMTCSRVRRHQPQDWALPSHLPFLEVQKRHSQNKITQDEINPHSLSQPEPPTQAMVLKTLHSNSAFFFFFLGRHALLSHKPCTRHVTQDVSQWNRKWPVRLCVLFLSYIFFFCSSFTESEASEKKKKNSSPSRSTSCWRLWAHSLLCNFLPLDGQSEFLLVCTHGLQRRSPCGGKKREKRVRR